jgi:hypothetical protein
MSGLTRHLLKNLINIILTIKELNVWKSKKHLKKEKEFSG